MLSPEAHDAFEHFCDNAYTGDVIGRKPTVMLQLAVAMIAGCYPWMKYFLGVAEEEGITEEEIGAVEAIVMAVSACRIRTQLADARSKSGVGCGQTAAASPPAGATGAVSVGMWPRLDND